MKKRILSILLAMVMCMTLLPTVAMAEGPVAQIGKKTYTTLEEAIQDAKTGAIIKLLGNIELSNMILVDKKVTLDLNGKTVSTSDTFDYPKRGVLCVNYGGDLTVKDGVGGGKIESENVYAAISLTNSGEVQNDKADAKLTVESGTLKGKYYGTVTNGQRHGTEITINGGTLTGFDHDDSTSIYHPNKGNLTINGGILSGADGLTIKGGTVIINGGTFTSTKDFVDVNDPGYSGSASPGCALYVEGNYGYGATVSIKGGTFKSNSANAPSVLMKFNEPDDATITIFGGRFLNTVDLTKYLTTGLSIDPNTGIVYSPAKVEQTVKTAVVVAVGVATAAVVTKVVVDKLHEVKAAKAAAAEAEKAAKLAEMPTVAIGDSGDAVTTLQTELNAQGFNCGEADGFFGQNTLNAVLAFQTANGLDADGVVGAQTWGALL